MEALPISERIKELIIRRLESEKSDRGAAKKIKLSNTSIANIKSGTSIKLDTLDKVLEGYPELLGQIGQIFLEESRKKGTQERKPHKVKDLATISLELDELMQFKQNVEEKLKELENKTADLPAVKNLSNH